MIRCLPQGLCSWDFRLEGEGHHARIEFYWYGEEGAITADGRPLDVRKHGRFSGTWSLDANGQTLAWARKSNAFTRTFEISAHDDSLVLRAESALTRSFRLERPGGVIATISPDHAFTRRSTIEPFAKKWDFPTISFAFWLVALTWRRQRSSSPTPPAGMG